MYYYVLYLFNGNGVEQDREEAIKWIRKARNKYITEADYLYYRLLRFDLVNPNKRDLTYYKFHYTKAKTEEEDNDNDEEDEDELKEKIMTEFLQTSAIGGIKQSYYQYVFNNEIGIRTEIDYKTAFNYNKEDVDAGIAECMVSAGSMAARGKGMDVNLKLAVELIKNAADLEYYDGYYNYRIMLNDGF